MASPPNESSRYDAMYDWAGLQVFNYVRGLFNPHKDRILDVGAGWGKYAYLFPDYYIDANEIWGPYVDNEYLEKKYNQVFRGDICDMEFDFYDVIIMGDILEHIERPRAQELVSRLVTKCKELIVIVPFLYEQHPEDDNIYEEHLQADLTPELMDKLYPELKPLAIEGNRGIYIKK